MFNLLSSVGGIDSSRFQKPQSMKDQRVGPSASAEKRQAELSSKKLYTERSETGAGPSQKLPDSKLSLPTSSTAQAGPRPNRKMAKGDTNSQLDALLEGSLFNKSNRFDCTSLLSLWQDQEEGPCRCLSCRTRPLVLMN